MCGQQPCLKGPQQFIQRILNDLMGILFAHSSPEGIPMCFLNVEMFSHSLVFNIQLNLYQNIGKWFIKLRYMYVCVTSGCNRSPRSSREAVVKTAPLMLASSLNRNWLISWTWYTIWSTQRETSERRDLSKFFTLKSLMSVQIFGSTLFNILQVGQECFTDFWGTLKGEKISSQEMKFFVG